MVIAIFLILLILIQRGRGGGLAGAFGGMGGQQRVRHQGRRRLHPDYDRHGHGLDLALRRVGKNPRLGRKSLPGRLGIRQPKTQTAPPSGGEPHGGGAAGTGATGAAGKPAGDAKPADGDAKSGEAPARAPSSAPAGETAPASDGATGHRPPRPAKAAPAGKTYRRPMGPAAPAAEKPDAAGEKSPDAKYRALTGVWRDRNRPPWDGPLRVGWCVGSCVPRRTAILGSAAAWGRLPRQCVYGVSKALRGGWFACY